MHPRFVQFVAGVIACGLLSACAVGPNYRRPDVDVPPAFRGQDTQTQASLESLADLPWWSVFDDETLRGLIGEALKNSYDLHIAIARVEQARAQKMQAASSFFPQIGYQNSAQRLRTSAGRVSTVSATAFPPGIGPVPVTVPAQIESGVNTNQFTLEDTATWEVDLWGRIRRANQAALARLLATEEARAGVCQTLVASVGQAYFQLRELDLELAIAQSATTSFGQTLGLFQKQNRGGLSSDLEVSRAQAAQAGAQAAIPDIERRIALTENELALLLGRNPGPIPRGPAVLDREPPPVRAGIPAALLERRPDIREAEENLIAANADVGVAVGDFLPKVDLTGALGLASPELNLLRVGNGNIWSIGASVAGPVFEGGLLVGRYKEAKARWEEARLEYRRSVLNALGDVANALVSRQKFGESWKLQQRQVDALRRSVSLSRARYGAGLSNYFELLDSQQQLFPAENALAQARLNQWLATVQLYKALGGGWFETRKTEAPLSWRDWSN